MRDMRTFFQYATVADFCEPVERLTGRRVRSFLSAIDTQVDGLAKETFVLYPEGYQARPDRHRERLSADGRLGRVHALIGAADELVARAPYRPRSRCRSSRSG